jgi:hypothetical protein
MVWKNSCQCSTGSIGHFNANPHILESFSKMYAITFLLTRMRSPKTVLISGTGGITIIVGRLGGLGYT